MKKKKRGVKKSNRHKAAELARLLPPIDYLDYDNVAMHEILAEAVLDAENVLLAYCVSDKPHMALKWLKKHCEV